MSRYTPASEEILEKEKVFRFDGKRQKSLFDKPTKKDEQNEPNQLDGK